MCEKKDSYIGVNLRVNNAAIRRTLSNAELQRVYDDQNGFTTAEMTMQQRGGPVRRRSTPDPRLRYRPTALGGFTVVPDPADRPLYTHSL
jgi:hypothetical protein